MDPTPAPAAPPPATKPALPLPGFAVEAANPVRVETLGAAPPVRRWWRKRRFWGAAAALLLAACTILAAEYRSRQTRLIFINSGSAPVPALMVTAEGFTHTVPPLDGEASHRWVLPEGGVPAPVVILGTTATGADWQWQSGMLQPGTGTRLVLRVSADGTVEESSPPSFWSGLIGD